MDFVLNIFQFSDLFGFDTNKLVIKSINFCTSKIEKKTREIS
jgi:hypothetical protein